MHECPECGSTRIECIHENCVASNDVIVIPDEDNPQVLHGSEITLADCSKVRYQCGECGFEFKDDKGKPISDPKDLVAKYYKGTIKNA